MPDTAPPMLWEPRVDSRQTTRLGTFLTECEQRHGRRFADYRELWEWSVGDGLEACWEAIWDFFGVISEPRFERVLGSAAMPGATWFEGARLNYAEHALRASSERPDALALVAVSQTRPRIELSWRELADQVGGRDADCNGSASSAATASAAYLPNIPETVIAFLATASIGAIWTSCAPEFGVHAVLDRMQQVEPAVLIAVERYRYGGRDVSRRDELAQIRAGLPSLRHTVLVDYPDPPTASDVVRWSEFVAESGPLEFDRLAPEHPLYVLYSSGTTGLPKPIVHCHGGILLEHLKVLGLHADLGPEDRYFCFTTTGWMMWNYLVSGLLHGTRLVLFDGDPNGDGPDTLWRLAADERITWFGVGSPYLTACRRAGLTPGRDFDLSALRAVGATGAPLPADGFRWVYEHVSSEVLLSPISGGTDVCSAFVGGSPLTPVWEGEIPCSYLGAAVAAFDEAGSPVVGAQGELVITRPMPSMPVGFWGDGDGSRYRAAYFEDYPGVWRHGDWITITERGSCMITGRSDATLNRGGVRIGTAEIYRVVEAVDGVVDSLVVHLESGDDDGPGRLVLFVVLAPDYALDDQMRTVIQSAVRAGLSPRHVPDVIDVLRAIPTTLTGKKLEVPVKKILQGADPDAVASRGALKDPSSLDEIVSKR